MLRGVINQAKRAPQRVVYPQGAHEKVLRAAQTVVDEGFAQPILIGKEETILHKIADLDLPQP